MSTRGDIVQRTLNKDVCEDEKGISNKWKWEWTDKNVNGERVGLISTSTLNPGIKCHLMQLVIVQHQL